MRRAVALLAILLSLTLVAPQAEAQSARPVAFVTDGASPSDLDLGATWRGWRGPERDGHAPGSEWPEGFGRLARSWRVPLEKSFTGPIVGADRVFDIASADNGQVILRALSRADGSELWRQTWNAPGSVPFFAQRSGDWVRSTPAYDGQTLYVGDMHEVLRAIDGATGAEIWRVDFPARYGTDIPPFGFASSPMIEGAFLYVQAANGLVKLRRDTGESLWHSSPSGESMMNAGAFSSPVMAKIGGVRQLVTFTRTALVGIDPANGAILWERSVPNFRGMNIVTPVVWKDAVLVSQYQNGTYLYPAGAGAATAPAWHGKASGYMSTPIVIDEHAYVHLGNGRFTCIDLTTGEEKWRTQSFGDYWSLVYRGDKILALDSDGVLRMIRANPERFELIDEIEVAAQPTWGHIGVTNDEVYIRELEGMTVMRWGTASVRPTGGR